MSAFGIERVLRAARLGLARPADGGGGGASLGRRGRAGHRAGRRLHRLLGSARPARRRRGLRRARCHAGGGGSIEGEIAAALRGVSVEDRAGGGRAGSLRSTARRTSPASAPMPASPCRWRRPGRARRRRACRSGAGSRARGRSRCRPRKSRSSAAAPMPGRRVDIQDFMVTAPGAASFAQACAWTAEVYRAAGLLMAEAGTAPRRGGRGRLLAGLRHQ